ncbi:MAG: hypothetical protein ACR2OC_09910 [Solirubrobacterales bacterium]
MSKEVKVRRRKGWTRLSRKNQVTIPVAALEKAGVEPGDLLCAESPRSGEILLRTEGRGDWLSEYSGSMTGVYESGYLEKLRQEWDR